MENKIEYTEEMIDQVAEKMHKVAIDQVFKRDNEQNIQEFLDKLLKENESKLGAFHIARGMRDVRALDPKNTRKKISLTYPVLCAAYALAAIEIGEELKEDEQKSLEDALAMSGVCLFEIEDGSMIYLEAPIEHHIIDDVPGGKMKLHNWDGPSILFADGSCRYDFNDIQVDEKFALTPAGEIKPEDVMAIPNIDARAQVIKKVGIERMTEGCAQIDADQSTPFGPYKLVNMSHLYDGRDAVCLDMICPSTGNHHVEGVDNECKTIQESINWRAKLGEMCPGVENWIPSELDGVLYPDGNKLLTQQGDAYIMALDSVPEGLTQRSDRLLQGPNTLVRHVIESGVVYDGDGFQVVVNDVPQPLIHPQHGTTDTMVPAIAKIWTGREVDHGNQIVMDLLD